MEKINIYAADWCDLVFENRNRNYGAFILRQYSSKRHLKAILLTFLFVLAIIAYTRIQKLAEQDLKIINTEVMKPGNIKIENNKPSMLPKVLMKNEPIKVISSIRFVQPNIILDKLVKEDNLPSMDDLLDTKAAISTITVKGNVDEGGIVLQENNMLTEHAKLTEETKVFTGPVEVMPAFPGGDQELRNYLVNNLSYPVEAAEAGVKGTVYLSFIVGLQGQISDIKIVRGIGFGCDEEAVRVIKRMPNWIVGRQNGHPVRVQFNLPIRFELAN